MLLFLSFFVCIQIIGNELIRYKIGKQVGNDIVIQVRRYIMDTKTT